jgi:hypothetical protein
MTWLQVTVCLSITVPNIKTYVGVQHGHDMATGNCLYFCSLFYNMK